MNHAPLAGPLFRCLDKDLSSALEFPEIARAVALQRASPERRCQLFFEMADTDANGVVSLEELVAVVKLIEPQAAVRGSPEYRYTMAIHKALGEGRVSYCALWSVLMRSCPYIGAHSWVQASQVVHAVAGYSSKAPAVAAMTAFMSNERGIDLDSKHEEGDFSTIQLVLLTFLMMVIGLILTFTSVAPLQFSSQHLAAALADQADLKMCTEQLLCVPCVQRGSPLPNVRVRNRLAAWNDHRCRGARLGRAVPVLEGEILTDRKLCAGGCGVSMHLHRPAGGPT